MQMITPSTILLSDQSDGWVKLLLLVYIFAYNDGKHLHYCREKQSGMDGGREKKISEMNQTIFIMTYKNV